METYKYNNIMLRWALIEAFIGGLLTFIIFYTKYNIFLGVFSALICLNGIVKSIIKGI